ncbi:hypothetical protein BKA62DRAFT_761948 [Auriculariales sp. MPI-PUGE-AT-0066]|nr:hypothetical protein BKA62DRAFT_761948 [Auriculariales sp. MPI-PUGE-AT-0066]
MTAVLSPHPHENWAFDPVRNEKLWFEDGNLVLCAGGALYKIHKSVLARHSTFFRDMFDIANATDALEGTESCPLEIPSVPEAALTDLLAIIYDCAGIPIMLSTPRLINVLRTAQRYDFNRMTLFSIDAELDPTLKLAIGLGYPLAENIGTWVVPALQKIVLDFSISVAQLAAQDENEALWTPDGLNLIHATREAVVKLRRNELEQRRMYIMRYPGGGRALMPEYRYDLITKIITTSSREDWFVKGVTLRMASQPNAKTFGSDIGDLTEDYLEKLAPSTREEQYVVETMWENFVENARAREHSYAP